MKRNVMGIVVALVIVGGMFAAVTRSVRAYWTEAHRRLEPFSCGSTRVENRLDAFVTLLSIDPIQGQATARVALHPQGSLSDDQGNPARRLKVFSNNAAGTQDRFYPPGRSMDPYEMTVNLFDGQASDYPYDHFSAELEFQISDPSSERLVPVAVYVIGNVQGYEVSTAIASASVPGYVRISLSVQRSETVVHTAVGGMIVMWAIAVAVLGLTLSILFWEHEAETFTFYSGLLFALFAFRNSLPGTPPVGTLSDYLAFFWAELVVAVSLIVTIVFSLLPRRTVHGGDGVGDSDKAEPMEETA